MNSTARRYLGFSATLLVFSSLHAPAEAQVAPGAWLSVRSGPAYIQLEPHPMGGVVAELTQATLVQASQFRDGWYYVRLPRRGTELADRWGWIAGTSVLPSAPPQPVRQFAVTSTQADAAATAQATSGNRDGWWASVKRKLRPLAFWRRKS